MNKIFVLLLFCHASSTMKHSLKHFLTATSGVQNLPEFVGVAMVDDVQLGYCDSKSKTAEPKQDWVRKLIKDKPHHLGWYSLECSDSHMVYRASMNTLKQYSNQTGDIHILQKMEGCEWDDETGEVTGFGRYGYNGEDFILLDLKTLTWITLKPEALIFKQKWDTDRARLEYYKTFFNSTCPEILRSCVKYGGNFLLRKDLPSVSLLQKTSSSPVRCFATGFYPDRAMMFWRRDGVEIHEDVGHGEILPNQDGTFQMSVDLDVSSVRAEDWGKLECVFQLSGVKEHMVTRLDRARIQTNEENPSYTIIIGVVVVLVLIITATGFLIYRKRNATRPPPPPSVTNRGVELKLLNQQPE